MSSSDSEDDSFLNIARKLSDLKKTRTEDLDAINTDSIHAAASNSPVKSGKNKRSSPKKATKLISTDSESSGSIDMDVFRSEHPPLEPQRKTRGRKRKSAENSPNLADSQVCLPRRRKTSKASTSAATSGNAGTSSNASNATNEPPARSRGKGRGRGRGRKSSNSSVTNAMDCIPSIMEVLRSMIPSSVTSDNATSDSNAMNAPPARRRGRGRGRANNRSNNSSPATPSIMDVLSAMIPTYSVGNTDEYPDQSDTQQLFGSRKDPAPAQEEEEEPSEDNEVISVKVYWQSSDYFKFPIRKYQKFTMVYDFFAKRETVGYDKLYFEYNDKIIKPEDTPDSIDYNLAKFISGGVVKQSVAHLTSNPTDGKNGVKLKFQCQNEKKPFEISVNPDDKFSIAMMRCAEHFEKPVDKLRFEFDGDVISGKSTAKELELEGGECIDVKVLS